MSDPIPCIWKPEDGSSRKWYAPVDHPEEDSEHPSVMRVWLYCPYCGRPIVLKEAK